MNQVPDWGQVAALVVAGVFLLMSGLVSASEAAFFSLLPSDVQVLKDSARQRDRMLVSLLGRSDRMLTSLQIADVFLNVGFVALCAYGLDAWIDGASSPVWWLVVEVVGLTLLLVNLGEILPKVLARRNALAGVRRMAVVLVVTYRVVAPFTNVVVRYTAAVNRRMERKKKELSVDDLSQALEMTAPEVKEEKEMLSEIIKFYNKTADEIMTPRMDIYGLDVSTKYQEVVEHVVKSGYSRIPVFERSEDHIKGILYAKDLFPHLNEAEDYAWQGLLRPAYFVPETKKIDEMVWPELIDKMDVTHRQFTKRLQAAYPKLQKADIRYCILWKLGYTKNTIIKLMNISEDNYHKRHQRIRARIDNTKKWEKGELEQFIQLF